MTQSPKNNAVGDTVAPVQRQNAESLRCAADQGRRIPADAASIPRQLGPACSFAVSAKNKVESNGPPGSCIQKLWFSFFFDGTGNNMEADIGTLKHSNVVRLYRAHQKDDRDVGIYRFYIPGLGTYCKEAHDDGGSVLGYGFGDKGEERLTWAFDLFNEKMQLHIARAHSPINAIAEINVAAFGFSRGAALARAFIGRFADRCVQDDKGNWRLKSGKYIVRIRFMGLFDTVASVGPPMAANTTDVGDAVRGVSHIIHSRLNDNGYADLRPQLLAFAKGARAGADPAPGKYNGHSGWGEEMRIPEMVEEVRHFVAAHEIRNSFPLDSVSVLEKGAIDKPARFSETVYPGVHSDVGGGYRPGEGGRSERPDRKLGLIPLADMYSLALAKGVPLLANCAWKKINHDDFDIDPLFLKTYAHYSRQVSASANLGDLFNAHMAQYYAWRFRAIHRKMQGDRSEADHVNKNAVVFKAEGPSLEKTINILETADKAALDNLNLANLQRQAFMDTSSSDSSKIKPGLVPYDRKVAAAQETRDLAHDEFLRAKAKLDALPNDTGLAATLEMYDKQLLADAHAIHDVYSQSLSGRVTADPAKRKELRPHYLAMMTAFENEFDLCPGKKGLVGLTDKTVIEFFDTYVHNSLAGFAKDATLPSDPRAIYLGGSKKYEYAALDNPVGEFDSGLGGDEGTRRA
jgi:hypothetical protein